MYSFKFINSLFEGYAFLNSIIKGVTTASAKTSLGNLTSSFIVVFSIKYFLKLEKLSVPNHEFGNINPSCPSFFRMLYPFSIKMLYKSDLFLTVS